MSREVPEPWAGAMVAADLVDPRNGKPSMSKLAEAATTHASTISAMMFGTRQTSPDVVKRVAAALQMQARVSEVFAWVGSVRQEDSDFVPHPDAELLTAGERAVINDLIRVMVAGRRAEPPIVMSLEEARALVADARLAEQQLPRGLRPDLVTVHPDGTQTVWEVSAASRVGKNRRNRMAEALFVAQAVQNATGRSTRAAVVEVPTTAGGPRSLSSKPAGVEDGEAAVASLLAAVGGGLRLDAAAHEEETTLLEEQGHPQEP